MGFFQLDAVSGIYDIEDFAHFSTTRMYENSSVNYHVHVGSVTRDKDVRKESGCNLKDEH